MIRAAVLAVAWLLLAAPAVQASALPVAAAQLAVFSLPASIVPIPASVDLKPETLERDGTGLPVTAFVELPPDLDVRAVIVASVRLCVGLAPCADGAAVTGKPKVGDGDRDGVPELKVAFPRQAVIELVDETALPADVTFAVSGLIGTNHFAGADVVRLVP